MTKEQRQVPITVVIFGITGDLAHRKLIPSLFELWESGNTPERFRIVGFSRREFSDEVLRADLSQTLRTRDEAKKQQFLSLISYKQGDFSNLDSYKDLSKYLSEFDKKWKVCSNKLLYLAVPPHLYANILEKIHDSGLSIPCGGRSGFNRVLIEKPFGNDLKTAKKLDALLGKLFKEEQIYRIDHYLGKETLQNILTFRFSNTIFEPLWNSKHIEKIEIDLFEKNTVSDRGVFYDALGALKDVGQNHMLAMLSLILMSKPHQNSSEAIREKRQEILKSIKVPEWKVFKGESRRMQYQGFKKELGVTTLSDTETYFEVGLRVSDKRWRGLRVLLRSGKALSENKTQIKIYFKDPDPKTYLPNQFTLQEKNILTFNIQPDEGISLLFWFKVPGFESKIEPRKLHFKYADGASSIPDAYERVLYDCMMGDQTLFPSTKEIMHQWKIIENLQTQFKKLPLVSYKQNTDPNKFKN